MYNVILVDDEIVAVNALKKRIDWQKYNVDKVHIARSMKQAQQVFQENDIQIMLCDIEMPNGSGLDLFEWVKCFYPHVECIYVTCHPDYQYVRKAMKLGSFDYVLKPVDFEELDGLLKQIIQRLIKSGRGAAEDGQTKSVYMPALEDEPVQEISATEETVESILYYIEQNIKDEISINDVAAYVHLNPIYVMRLFKSKTGKSILEYITNIRIEQAKSLLAGTSYSVQKIADQVGYGNYSYFTRIFKKNTGMTPNAYRKAYQTSSDGSPSDSSKS